MFAAASLKKGSDGGGWSKMSNEPLARERELIERVRARFEALRTQLPQAASHPRP